MIEAEADAIANLAISVEERLPQVSELLLREVTRARICKADRIPSDVVTMGATVRFIDEANDKEFTYQLVYPQDADIASGRISILTPVGAGLIGLRKGQAILWPDRGGHERKLTILDVVQASDAA